MAVKVWNVGDVLTAADMNVWTVPIEAAKASGTTRTTVTLATDPDLQITLAANAAYDISCIVSYNTGANGVNSTFVIPSGASAAMVTYNGPGGQGAGNWTGTMVFNSSTTGSILYIGRITTTNSGTLGYQWASNTGATSLTINTNSFLRADRVG